ncbi:MliC family protein [Paraburkholderia caribensis]|uniref:MliC family protein n=1 Tax=Paraburkholderia caribensis TaxID=75105 RepID=A0A9Q6WM22_9BURK|nr:MliC family protein [Paraburkholderia caribensis]ALP62451.1 transcriptional regulator [Paraburkholderia caribensis]AMV43202.1 transcriptional regulator [Paraburkholderia caribensis]AUT52321.1 transcriptional regulator [Paraburkholderia caribensis]MCO4878334.1 MliC family protein [Paraburkholderia caribensis]MDR6382030.1 membrane-bound inhibitor of C-type lysozyme [Paraburkholderia caribensis]
MSRRWVASVGVLAFVAASGVARAAGLSPLPDIRTSHRVIQKYTCATGRILQVTYLNATNGQSFAVLPVKGRQMLFVNVLSGSGAKYQAGSYTWWTKGPQATLYDAMQGEDAPPLLSDCVTIVR